MTRRKVIHEHNPAVATYTEQLGLEYGIQVDAAKEAGDPLRTKACARSAVAFWKRQLELHPDVPALKVCADDASKMEAEATKWASTQPVSTP